MNKAFRYEHMWERLDSLSDVILESWHKRNPGANLSEILAKLVELQQSLSTWARTKFGSVIKQTGALRKQLEILWERSPSPERGKEIKTVSRNLDELLHRVEMMWRQRSRALWLREGDRNTRYFQRKASWRRKNNTIIKLKDERGEWVENKEKQQEMTTNFFKELYTKEGGLDPNLITNYMNEKVTTTSKGVHREGSK